MPTQPTQKKTERRTGYGRCYEWFAEDNTLGELSPWAWKAFMLYLTFARFKRDQKWWSTVCHRNGAPMTRGERAKLVGVTPKSMKRIEGELEKAGLVGFRRLPAPGNRKRPIALRINDFEKWRPADHTEAASVSTDADMAASSISIGEQVPHQPESDMEAATEQRPLQGPKDARKEEGEKPPSPDDESNNGDGHELLDEADRCIVNICERLGLRLDDKQRHGFALAFAGTHRHTSAWDFLESIRNKWQKYDAKGIDKRGFLMGDLKELQPRRNPVPYEVDGAKQRAREEMEKRHIRTVEVAGRTWEPRPWEGVVAAMEAEKQERREAKEAREAAEEAKAKADQRQRKRDDAFLATLPKAAYDRRRKKAEAGQNFFARSCDMLMHSRMMKQLEAEGGVSDGRNP